MKRPRDIVAIIVSENGREERLNLRGDNAELRFRRLQDALKQWDDEWAAFRMHMSPEMVAAIREFHQLREEASIRKRRRAGKQTAKKMKQKAALHRQAVIDAHRAGYPDNIGPRHRVSHIAQKTGLSAPTVRKYLPGRKRKKASSPSK